MNLIPFQIIDENCAIISNVEIWDQDVVVKTQLVTVNYVYEIDEVLVDVVQS